MARFIPSFIVGNDAYQWGGLNTAVKDPRFLPRGDSYDQLNWITGRDKDHIELRRGSNLLGSTRRNVAGAHATGLGVGIRNDGVQVPYFSYNRKILYYDVTINDTVEVTTPDILPADANGEDVNFMPYENLAGAFSYVTSPNSSIYKIPIANPGFVVDQGVDDFHFGFAKINRGRMYGMNRVGNTPNSRDITGNYLSHIDKQLVSDYTTNFMSVPPAPTLVQGVGGTIADNTYYFSLTVFGPRGVETTLGAEGTIIVAGGGGVASIQVSFPNVAGATRYELYGTTTSGVYTTPALARGAIVPASGALNTLTLTTVAFAAGAPPASTTQGIIAPLAVGNGIQVTFTGTLTQAPPLTNFYFSATDGIELFTDDRSGVLIGSLGGTGTINYATGAWSLTFNTAPANGAPITGSYYQENATSGGVADFTINITDLTNASAQIFRQDDGGGKAMACWPYQGVEYAFHVLRSWVLSQSQALNKNGDMATNFNNQPYYEQVGIPFPRALFPTGRGIVFLNNATAGDPKVSILQIPPGSTNLTVVPVEMSKDLDLSGFSFDRCVVWSWGDYDIVSCQNIINGQIQPFNGATFVRNIHSELWNKLDYYIAVAGEYNGTLIAGDSITPNVFTLFSGFDDDGAVISNYHKQAYTDLELEGLKTVGYIHLEGLIQKAQKLEVYISLDNGAYVLAYTILGTGAYVSSNVIAVGTNTIGANVVGGGTGSQQVFANEYEIDIPIHTDKFEYISFMVKAIDVGYVSINKQEYKDIRFKRRRILPYDDLEINN